MSKMSSGAKFSKARRRYPCALPTDRPRADIQRVRNEGAAQDADPAPADVDEWEDLPHEFPLFDDPGSITLESIVDDASAGGGRFVMSAYVRRSGRRR